MVRLLIYGSFLYAPDVNISPYNLVTYQINQQNGSLSQISSITIPTVVMDLEIDSSNRFLYTALSSTYGIESFKINNSTGTLTRSPNSPYALGGTNTNDIACNPNGDYLYGVSDLSDYVYACSINRSTGELSVTYSLGATNAPRSCVVDPTGEYLYVGADPNVGSDGIIRIYKITGSTFYEINDSPVNNGSFIYDLQIVQK